MRRNGPAFAGWSLPARPHAFALCRRRLRLHLATSRCCPHVVLACVHPLAHPVVKQLARQCGIHTKKKTYGGKGPASDGWPLPARPRAAARSRSHPHRRRPPICHRGRWSRRAACRSTCWRCRECPFAYSHCRLRVGPVRVCRCRYR